MTNKLKGTVKFYKEDKGYGFITGEDGTDYFFHSSGLVQGVSVGSDTPVAFELVTTDRGEKAINVVEC